MLFRVERKNALGSAAEKVQEQREIPRLGEFITPVSGYCAFMVDQVFHDLSLGGVTIVMREHFDDDEWEDFRKDAIAEGWTVHGGGQ